MPVVSRTQPSHPSTVLDAEPDIAAANPAAATPAPLDALHGRRKDLVPLLVVAAIAIVALPLVGSIPTWVTLTVAGLAMGMMLFIMASGLTLVFGLMDVLNLGHGAFIAVGAYVATLVLAPFAASMQADSLWINLAVLAPAALLSMAVSGALGLIVER